MYLKWPLRYAYVIFVFIALFYPYLLQESLIITPKAVQQSNLSKFIISNKINDARDDLENVLSITHHNTATAQEGLTIFGVWRVSSPNVEHFIDSMIVIADMEGNIKSLLQFPISKGIAWDPEFINSTTFVYILTSNSLQLHNIKTKNTEVLPISPGHHDVEYNPITDTFLTVYFTHYGYYMDKPLLFDDIYEHDRNGNVVWYWNSSTHIPFNETEFTKEAFFERFQWTHANTIFWDIEDHSIYYNCRHLDTFYKIDYPSGEILWSAGRLGNLRMFDKQGKEKQSLFYHSHAVEVIGPNRYIIFDNDYFNTTRENPREPGISRMIEVIVNEETKTMNETWSWSAPADYFGEVWGDADRLPNRNRLGTFGVTNHTAYITEVDPHDNIVWELALEQGKWDYLGIYNADRFFEAPLVEVDQTEVTLAPDEDLMLQVRTWDTFDTRITRKGYLTIEEKNKVLKSVDFEYLPHWQETLINVSISSLGNTSRTLNLIITNEDGLSTNTPISINGGASEETTSTTFSSESDMTISTSDEDKISSEHVTTSWEFLSLIVGFMLINTFRRRGDKT
ncbi:MAG: aryl-sulfate sulfotransferase [Candidatus Hodarchaeales archaeon]